ncbi:arginyltransferase [Parasalinivibrio latis]|uniref:arginyltransferase n=1 Tax=Parasalinivibrio latis TaxID=2952610 RepID=UPI0030E2FCA3
MSTNKLANGALSVGLTAEHRCNYLPDQQERLAIVMDPGLQSFRGYSVLIEAGFRRSGNHIYRPHCNHCNACKSLRIDVNGFTPSRSQKRLLKQLDKLTVLVTDAPPENWFELYSNYITQRHRDGSMFPPVKSDFLSFIRSNWLETRFLQIYQQEKIIAVAATDILQDGLSAIYTFFDPDIKMSVGSLSILAQLALAKKLGKDWLYLGYQVDACDAMKYKSNFFPHQQFIHGAWQEFDAN